jgi:hypothetical protein
VVRDRITVAFTYQKAVDNPPTSRYEQLGTPRSNSIMTIGQIPDLDSKVLEILKRASGPQSVSDIEAALAGQIDADTFDVRDAVWRLVREQQAKFTPLRRVTLPDR